MTEQGGPSFIKEVIRVRTEQEAAQKRREEIAGVAKGIHQDLRVAIEPHLPKLPKPKKINSNDELALALLGHDDFSRALHKITRSVHELRGAVVYEEGEATISITVDGDYAYGRGRGEVSGLFDITIEGLPDRYLVSPSGIRIESIQRELLPSHEIVIGGHNPSRAVSSRMTTDEDIAKLQDLALRLADPLVKLEHSSYPKHF